MARAIEAARRGAGMVSPNPIVGAVAVRAGEIIGEGWHSVYGGLHAERDLIARITREHGVEACRGADLYVTLEPCAHHGKTPPCSEAVIEAGFARVFVGCDDPNPKTRGRSYEQFAAAGIPVVRGVEERAARELTAAYLCQQHAGRSLLTAKWAMTADGKIATATGDAAWISAEETRAATRRERGTFDAILVGIGTVRADDPSLTARTEGVRDPLRVVLDPHVSIDRGSRLVESAKETPLLIIAASEAAGDHDFETRREALVEAGVEVALVSAAAHPGSALQDSAPQDSALQHGERRLAPLATLEELSRRGVAHVLLEGGGQIHGAFLDAGLVDRVQVIVAPKICGGAGALGPVLGRGVESMAEAPQIADPRWRVVGPDLILEGSVTAAGRGEWPTSSGG